MGCLHTFKISGKEEPEEIKESKQYVFHVFKNLTILSNEENFFFSQLSHIIEENFCAAKVTTIGNWPVMSD
jgi:hypothetical protein